MAALVAAAVLGLGAVPAGDPAEAALPVLPGADPQRPTVRLESQVNNRTVDSAIGVGKDANVYVWGRTGFGMSGVFETDWAGIASKEWPVKVSGLPEGSITAVASGIYNFNALDTAGHVWGWGGWTAARDGTGSARPGSSCGISTPPARLRVGSAWDGNGPLLSGITTISATEYAGAGIAADGSVYRWGRADYGGNHDQGDACPVGAGATTVPGLPDPSVPGNFPVYLKGGYTTFWVILENGDVYYWGGTNAYERPRAADGGAGDTSGSVVRTATRSSVLAAWLSAHPGVSIVAVDSGINLGGALLSDGRVLTWGANPARVGGRLPNDGTADVLRQARTAGVLPNISDAVLLAFTFTGGTILTDQGDLYGYGEDSYECYPTWPNRTIFCGGGVTYPTVPGLLDTQVVALSVGQGYVRWTRWVDDDTQPDGFRYEVWAQGYNPRAAIGHPVGTAQSKRRVVFRTDPFAPSAPACGESRCDLADLLK